MAHWDHEGQAEIGVGLSLLSLFARPESRTRRKEAIRRQKSPELDMNSLDNNEYPVLPLQDMVVFPNLVTPLFIGRDLSIRAVEAAEAMEVPLLVVAQRDPEIEDPDISDLYSIGTAVEIGRVLRMPDGSSTVLVQGIERVRILELVDTEPYLRVIGAPLYEDERHDMASEALMRAVLALFEKVVQLNPSLPEDAYVAAMNEHEPGNLADLLAHILDLELAQRQEVLETLDANVRLQRLSILLGQELDVLELESRIQTQVQQEVDKSQREYYLREQLHAIQTELGEDDESQHEIAEIREQLETAHLPDDVRAKAEKEIKRLVAMPPASPETTVVRTYLDWLLGLPWRDATEDNLDIARAAAILERNHYGLPKVKERILEHIAVHKLAQEKMKSPIICFVGPPGTGKTSLGKSIAEALGRKFVRFSLGGVRDEAEIRGHRRTYIGSLPGRILQTMHTAGSINPLFMLDEVDKLGTDFRGDPSSALLEVLDPEQNHAFSDHYLEVPYDLSKVMFITTANILDPIPPALRDRMEVIEFPGYIEEEKLAIARQFLVPRQLEAHGLRPEQARFGEAALRTMIREYTYEAGVRNLERHIANVCRKVARRVAEEKTVPHRITPRMLNRFLGPPQFNEWLANETDDVGVANGLAWTEAGGDVMQVEVSAMEGKGSLILTGQLGEVMQESAQAALTYTRAHAAEFGLGDLDFDKIDLHIHVPEGGIPKDGPSAGVTMATALISALSERPIRHDVAMTGEITLRGRVLPIGGLKEKLMAAHRMHLKMVLIPKRNEKDLVDVPRNVQHDLDLVLVERMDEILKRALLPIPPPPLKARRSRARPKKTAAGEQTGEAPATVS
ncbi:MAG: endopeptidase La [Anaerolineae bacterium CG2_30_64_16]|nr:MAG: endopeptidase La [Anaerolineae bacterium CG2_30_64_16]